MRCQPVDKGGFVYIFKMVKADSVYKIGNSINPIHRVIAFKNEEEAKIILFQYVEDRYKAERMVHKILTGFRYDGFHGKEYFKLSDERLELVIKIIEEITPKNLTLFYQSPKENNSDITSIRLHQSTKDLLNEEGQRKESDEEVVIRLINEVREYRRRCGWVPVEE
jgi:hypothetical protein